MLWFYCTQTHKIIQYKFSREFLKTIFARLPPLASAARCGPHPPHLLATPVSECEQYILQAPRPNEGNELSSKLNDSLGVDGSCAKHLTVESYTVVMLLTFILIITSIPSPPHSFIPGLKPSFSAIPPHPSLPFLLQTDSTDFSDCLPTSENIRFLLFSFSVLYFSVVGSVRQIKLMSAFERTLK